jgi:hypothetical protein
MLARIRTIFKFVEHHNWLELLRRVWNALIKVVFEKRCIFIMKLVSQDIIDPNPDFEIKELGLQHIKKMLKVMYLKRTDLYNRFGRGERCFAVLNGGQIASYFWAQFHTRQLSEISWVLNLKPNQVWFYNAITVKGARGRGYYPNIIRYMAKVLEKEGFTEFFIDVEERNRSSIRGVEKAGCKRVVRIQMSKLLSKVRYKVTVFDEDTWRELLHEIKNVNCVRCLEEDKVCQ